MAVARYSEHSVAQDLEPLTIDEVTESSPLRIFRAGVTAAFMLEDERDFRTAVEAEQPVSEALHGRNCVARAGDDLVNSPVNFASPIECHGVLCEH